MWWLLWVVWGCSVPETQIYPVQVRGVGLTLDPVAVKIRRLTLEPCQGEPDLVAVHRWRDLAVPRPIAVPDRPRCGISVDIAEPFRLRGQTYGGTHFSYTLPAQVVTVRQEFDADGALLALALDPAPLFDAAALEEAEAAATPPGVGLSYGEDDPESARLSLLLPRALHVDTLAGSSGRYGGRWPFPPEAFYRADTGQDRLDSLDSPGDSLDSPDSRDSRDSPPDSRDSDTAHPWRLDTGTGGGCGGGTVVPQGDSADGSGADSGSSDSGSTDQPADSTPKDLSADSDSGGDGGGCGCGGGDDSGEGDDSGDDSGDSARLERGALQVSGRGGLAAVVIGAWSLRRRRAEPGDPG